MSEDATCDQIRGLLGSLLWLWSAIERAAREEAPRAHGGELPRSARGIAAVLSAWEAAVRGGQDAAPMRSLLASRLRDRLQVPLGVRNGVCHGLIGLAAAHGGRPASLTWELDGVFRSITWDELQTAFGWLSKVPDAISAISNFPAEEVGGRMQDNAENRRWWLAEYGLELPEPRRGEIA